MKCDVDVFLCKVQLVCIMFNKFSYSHVCIVHP